MDLQTAALIAASLNLVAALVGFPVLWDRVNRLTAEVHDLRGNVRQLELGQPGSGRHPGEAPHG